MTEELVSLCGWWFVFYFGGGGGIEHTKKALEGRVINHNTSCISISPSSHKWTLAAADEKVIPFVCMWCLIDFVFFQKFSSRSPKISKLTSSGWPRFNCGIYIQSRNCRIVFSPTSMLQRREIVAERCDWCGACSCSVLLRHVSGLCGSQKVNRLNIASTVEFITRLFVRDCCFHRVLRGKFSSLFSTGTRFQAKQTSILVSASTGPHHLERDFWLIKRL